MTRLLGCRAANYALCLYCLAGKNHGSCAFNAAANPVAAQMACGRDEQDLSWPPAEISNAHRRRMDNH